MKMLVMFPCLYKLNTKIKCINLLFYIKMFILITEYSYNNLSKCLHNYDKVIFMLYVLFK